MDLLNINRPWDCQVFPKSKTIIYGGSGGGGWGFSTSNPISNAVESAVNTVVEPVVQVVEPVVETVEDVVETVQEIPMDNPVSNILEPVVNTVVEPVLEIAEPVAETVQDAGEVAQLMVDVAHSVVTGEPQGSVAESQEELQDFQDAANETAEDYQDALDNISDATTETINTTNEVIADTADNAVTTVQTAADDLVDAFVDAGILTRPRKGGDVSEETRGGDIIRDEELLQLNTKKSALKAKKKRGKKGLRIDYATNIPGMGKSGLAA